MQNRTIEILEAYNLLCLKFENDSCKEGYQYLTDDLESRL